MQPDPELHLYTNYFHILLIFNKQKLVNYLLFGKDKMQSTESARTASAVVFGTKTLKGSFWASFSMSLSTDKAAARHEPGTAGSEAPWYAVAQFYCNLCPAVHTGFETRAV